MWPFKRKEWEKCGASWTYQALEENIHLKLSPGYLDVRDKDIRSISTKDFEKLVFDCWFPNDYQAYRSEIWDCDNWSVAFMARVQERWAKVSKGKEALAFGYIAAYVEGMGYHAFIWHMDDKGIIRYYEPQTGKRVDYKCTKVALVEL